MPCALITGVTGQDGSYLAEFLIEKGYEVHGLARRVGANDCTRLRRLIDDPTVFNHRLFLHAADLNDSAALRRILSAARPEEVYHLAAATHVGESFEKIVSTCEVTAMGTLRFLEMIRSVHARARVFYASSSEVFGLPETSPQDERTPFRPATPYGCAKAFATQMVSIYRQSYGLFACNGILFNHESPRRGADFATQKICLGAAAIKEGRQPELVLGSLTSQRDWGDARDYVRGMWLVLQYPTPEDFVFSTGELHSVQEVVEMAFEAMALDWRPYVRQDPKFLRPDEPGRLIGNAAKARRLLGWRPTTPLRHLITEMTLAGLRGATSPSDAKAWNSA
jgi:GDPmannose 4,6-dehydratase